MAARIKKAYNICILAAVTYRGEIWNLTKKLAFKLRILKPTKNESC